MDTFRRVLICAMDNIEKEINESDAKTGVLCMSRTFVTIASVKGERVHKSLGRLFFVVVVLFLNRIFVFSGRFVVGNG